MPQNYCRNSLQVYHICCHISKAFRFLVITVVKVVNVIQVEGHPELIQVCHWINGILARSHSVCYLICLLQACKYALRQSSPLLGAEKINKMMQDHLKDAGSLHYPDFMADLVKIIVICLTASFSFLQIPHSLQMFSVKI